MSTHHRSDLRGREADRSGGHILDRLLPVYKSKFLRGPGSGRNKEVADMLKEYPKAQATITTILS
jgi:hypothetical protein